MKRYENVPLAVLVIALIALGAMDPSSSGPGLAEGRPHTRRSMVCTASSDVADLNSVIPKSARGARWDRRRRRRSRKADLLLEHGAGGFADDDDEDRRRESGAFWLRNACHDGFVTVKEKDRVLVQHEGLGKRDPEVKLVKESCLDLHHGSGLSDRVMTRLYSPSSGRYVCFNTRGKVKAVKPHKAERMGHLCAFYEHTVPDPLMTMSGGRKGASIYINIQSAYNRKWYLGFGPNLRRPGGEAGVLVEHGIVHTREGHRASLPRKMRHRGRRKPLNPAKCDFLFATGPWSRRDPESVLKSRWRGLFDHILHHHRHHWGSEIEANITKTAKSLGPRSYRLSPTEPSASLPSPSSSHQLRPKFLESNSVLVQEEEAPSASSSRRPLKSPVPKSWRHRPTRTKMSRRQKYRQLKYRRRKRPKSYLYLHNRQRIIPRKKTNPR